ncbi:hypothetical protein V5O48_014788 [Marasmius crinis-equi]|uniref:Uncharacterized protein n=1 Tax=Marasmius crinis-equi TaxID=585013 RepID=A0ABR3EWA5_9AGAR
MPEAVENLWEGYPWVMPPTVAERWREYHNQLYSSPPALQQSADIASSRLIHLGALVTGSSAADAFMALALQPADRSGTLQSSRCTIPVLLCNVRGICLGWFCWA